MIPSLVAGQLRQSLIEFLGTSFALSDDEAYEALTQFLLDDTEGIFRGPFLRLRLPFVDAPSDADPGVAWMPQGIQPYAHQVAAWRRLTGRGRVPQPTLITTGTGSGKSEGFLVPIIDHCIWTRQRGQLGIKALLLYPMNALVTDQERRIAALLADPSVATAGVRGGVWIGDDGSVQPRRDMDATHLISDPRALMDDPPDILLTNYKMLDRMLARDTRSRLWAANTPTADRSGWEQPLTYLVLDELHSYDGPQGTDVAMLLRRLGHRLGTATPRAPLGDVACIGTSATLGSARTAVPDMCLFAGKVFGSRFEASAVVGEERKTVAEVCPDLDFSMPIPNPRDLAAVDPNDLDALAEAFTGVGFDNSQAVGDRLLRHHLTASLLRIASGHPRRWRDAVEAVAEQVREWGAALNESRDDVEASLARFIALISQAKSRGIGGAPRPLFAVEVQLWIREVTRLLRSVTRQPTFRWADSGPSLTSDIAFYLPSIYCTSCGRAGWMGVANLAKGQGTSAIEHLDYESSDGSPLNPYREAIRERGRTRAMLAANANEPDVLWLDPDSGQVHYSDLDQKRIPVLIGGMTSDERTETSRTEAAQRRQCPSCGARDAIFFLGSRITTLAAVGITQMFGSEYVAQDERKLLAFTDSVQDASHRAAFFSGRTHRFNLRATLSAALQAKGRVALPLVPEVVLAQADAADSPADALFALIPPDLLREEYLEAAWRDPTSPAGDQARLDISTRLGFDAAMEGGLRSRFGRTLETTLTAVAHVVISEDEWERIVAFVEESLRANAGRLLADRDDLRTWALGVVERLRLRGGIYHPFLNRYVESNGNTWWIWGGGDRLAPRFPKGISAPVFFTSAPSDEFDLVGGAQTWLGVWTRKVLGADGPSLAQSLKDLLHQLTELGVLEARSANKGQVWGLPPERVEFVDVAALDRVFPATELRCDLCANRHYVPPEDFDDWLGRPCLRARCPGNYGRSAVRVTNYYRDLYRAGQIRRVVAAEHTGLLTRERRERIESGFKEGGSPDTPNVLTATPTLELGIDIGDLSAVMLTSVPRTQANYVQRVGRAGRQTGNAFVTTFAEGDPRSLYFLDDPELMISGEIAAPNCYLDAIEILHRQYLAFLVDQAAVGTNGLIPTAGQMPRNVRSVFQGGLEAGGWLFEILGAGEKSNLVDRFIMLFGDHLDQAVAAGLSSWASTQMTPHVVRGFDRWRQHLHELENQRTRLRERESALKTKEQLSPDDDEALGRLTAELRYIARRIRETNDQETLTALEELGLLPNYTLYDDTVVLEVNLWRPNDSYTPSDEQSSRFISENSEYSRSATIAIRELAPGNYFYVDAHRVRIDSVDNGTENEPAHRAWRFCPACAWATEDVSQELATCPRCGGGGIADQSSIVTVLPMTKVSATEREMNARVSDDTEDRDSEFHEVLMTVDIAPADVTAAFLHNGTVFGVESTRAATIRHLNLGLAASTEPRRLSIDDNATNSGLFIVCRLCGGVRGIRADFREPDAPGHHRMWCKVRSGARAQQWDSVALVHELVTEAVRILLPVAEFEVRERLASFKAALMLGLRESFGGQPSHLRVTHASFPSPEGPSGARNRFVVVHDTVPGGTGYLPRLADPVRLRQILISARDLIAVCECQTRGRPGCHKCLYGAVDRNEIPLVSRAVALELLDEVLTGWSLSPAPSGTITGVNLTRVVQSELERMFKSLLHRWSAANQVRLQSRPDPDDGSLTRFDLRFQDGPHWEIQEQVNLHHHHTKPDFYLTRRDRVDAEPVAVYLDGWEWHGNKPDQVDADSRRRGSLREGGIVVWTLTWNDVKAAVKAANQGASVAAVLPIAPGLRATAEKVAKAAGADDQFASKVVDQDAFGQLMTYLQHPEASDWSAVALGAAMAPLQGATRVWVDEALHAVDEAALGTALTMNSDPTDTTAITWQSHSALAITAVLKNGETSPTIVLTLDTSTTPDQGRWNDWIHLGNVFQFLRERSVITTTQSYAAGSRGPVLVQASVGIEESLRAALVNCFDLNARSLAEQAASAGYRDIVVGFEMETAERAVIEVAWPNRKVGILPAGAPTSNADGWTLLPSDEWTIESLVAALARSEGP